MTIGLSLIAAQYWGKGDIPAVERIFAFVMKVTTAISLIFTLSALLIPGMLMRIFTNDPILIRGGSLYLRVIAVSYLLTGISQMYLCILKNSGRAAKSSMISATSVVVNIFINAVRSGNCGKRSGKTPGKISPQRRSRSQERFLEIYNTGDLQ